MFLLLLSLILFFLFYVFYLFFWDEGSHRVALKGSIGPEYPPSFGTGGYKWSNHRLLYSFIETFEGFEGSNVQILSKDSVLDLLVYNPPDNYYDSFSDLDLKARNVKSLDEYLRKIRSVCFYSDDGVDKNKIIWRCIARASKDMVKEDMVGKRKWIDMNKLRALPWKIAVTLGGSTYEYGFPHTRGDVIVVNEKDVKDDDEFVDTLLHEQMHVYQKMYPEDFQKYLDSEGFVRYCRRNLIQNVAANPDADAWVYMKDGEVFVGQYSGRNINYRSVTFKPVNHPRFDCPQEYAI